MGLIRIIRGLRSEAEVKGKAKVKVWEIGAVNGIWDTGGSESGRYFVGLVEAETRILPRGLQHRSDREYRLRDHSHEDRCLKCGFLVIGPSIGPPRCYSVKALWAGDNWGTGR